jgi:hypothetical protein
MGNFDVNQLTMSRGLLEDFKKYAARDKVKEVVQLLQDQLDRNSTRTMTFTDDGLKLAIKLIKDKYGIED